MKYYIVLSGMKTDNLLIDLFDHSGHASQPYRDAGWNVLQVDIKNGIDIMTWNYQVAIGELVRLNSKIGLLAAIPCTDFACSGAKHFAKKDSNGETAKSDMLVDKVYEIKNYIETVYWLNFWRVENPRSRIHNRHKWLGSVKHKFNPCDYAGYTVPTFAECHELELLRGTDMMDASKEELNLVLGVGAYNKETWLWGDFNQMTKQYIQPVWKENPGWRLYGGKSERTKELRSIDPIGFCRAFYEANN